MIAKQKQERLALETRIDRIYKEAEKDRQRRLNNMLQKMINAKGSLDRKHKLQESKLQQALDVKNFVHQ